MAALLARSDMKYITCMLITVLILISCSGSRKQAEIGSEAILAQMRADTAWINTLDSLASGTFFSWD